MPPVKPLAQIVEKYRRRASAAGPDYQAGVSAPRVDWSQASQSGNDAWKQGVQQAVSEDRFARGVQSAGTSKWQRKAIALGVGRYGPGISEGAPDYEKGFAPVRQAIESVTLPPRGARGDPRNIERVRIIAEAARAAVRRS